MISLRSSGQRVFGSKPARLCGAPRPVRVGQQQAQQPQLANTCRRSHTALNATVLPGSSPDTQIFVVGKDNAEVPVTAVQQLPQPAQAAVFLGLLAGLSACTYALCSYTDLEWTRSGAAPFIFGIVFSAAGVAHFTVHDEFCSMMPTKGAWGLWYLPGSDSFHVNWTGVAEVAGGVGLLASAIPPVADAVPGLRSAAALGLFALSVAVTPSNIFMATHNAPGPGPKGAVIPLPGHIFRGIMQIVLWTALWGLSQSPAA